jgi:hypothetical protein
MALKRIKFNILDAKVNQKNGINNCKTFISKGFL